MTSLEFVSKMLTMGSPDISRRRFIGIAAGTGAAVFAPELLAGCNPR